MFKPKDLGAITKNFKSNKNGEGFKKSEYLKKIPRVVRILEVFPSKNGDGYFIAEDLNNGKKLNVVIDKETYQKEVSKERKSTTNAISSVRKFEGWIIDERVEEARKENDIFILGDSVPVKKREVINGEEVLFLSVSWLKQPTEQRLDKLRTGYITARASHPYVDETVSNYQLWNKDAIAIDLSEECSVKMGEFVEKFDEVANKMEEIKRAKAEAEAQNKKLTNISYPAKLGFQLRTYSIEKTLNDKGEETIVNTLRDTYEPLYLQYPDQDEFGNIVGKSQDISGEWFLKYVTQYSTWAYSTFTKQPKTSYDLEETVPSDVLVEVLIFEDFFANKLNEDNKINKGGDKLSPLDKMVRKETKPSIDSEEKDYYQGMNFSSYGIVEIAGDKFDTKTRTEIERNFVKKVHITADVKNIHYNIRCSNGGRLIIPDDLLTNEELQKRESYKNQAKQEFVKEEQQTVEALFDDEIL